MKKFLLFIIGLVFLGNIWGQAVYIHNFGTTTISTHPYTVSPPTFASGLSNSSWVNSNNTWTSFAGSSGQSIAITNSSGTPTLTLTFDINSGCTLDITSFNFWRQRSSTGAQNWSMTINGNNVGTGTVPTTGSNVGLTTVSGLTGITGTVTIVISLSGASGTGTFRLDDFTLNGTTSCGAPANTITTGAVTEAPFAVDCSTTDAGSIAFTSSGTFTTGNVFTVQLSNASGSFASPANIGSLPAIGSNPSGIINFTIPAGTVSGSGYLIRIISSPTSATSNSSAPQTINLSGGPCVMTPPSVTSMIYDGCNADCASGSEGRSEIVFGNTGSYNVLVSSANVTLTYITGGYTMTNSLVNNTATTATLNTEAGCPGLFIDGFNQTMPPGSSFLLASNTLCVTSMIWSDLCGSGPIYIIYSGGTWNDGGNFGNSGGVKNFSTSITATDGTVNPISYSYNAPGSGTDGNYATWTSAGGAASTQGNFPSCRIQPIVLPSSLLSFNGEYNNAITELYWQTVSEQNNSHFTVSHSSNGKQFNALGTVSGAGNSTELLNYRFVHSFPHPGMNYYKLQSTDYDGTTYEKGIVAINAEFSFSFYDAQTATIELYYESDIEIYSTDGKLIEIASEIKSIPFHKSGLFFILDKRSGITERIFIP